jgi:transposase
MALNDSPHQPQDGKEERRRRALELKADGWSQKLIAEAFGVSEAAVSKWVHRERQLGDTAWRAQPRSGARPKLPPNQLNLLPDLLSHGAEAYGFRGDVWTCARVASVIATEFAVTYHPAHVSRRLKQLDWTPQLPLTRAAQRDETRIAHWRAAIWPHLQITARQAGQTIVFIDEAALYLLPGVVKSYAPRGQPSVLRVVQSYDHLSVMSAVTPAG